MKRFVKTIRVLQSDIISFSEIVGDRNPVHLSQ